MRTRGFLLGGTSGRTTLNGEGLQHEDGHSHLFAASIPNCVPYDPTYAYEVATIVQDGMRRMLAEQEDVYYYITLLNENYQHPAMPAAAEDGILRGMYLLRDGALRQAQDDSGNDGVPRVQLMGSGSILREVLAAADLLRDDFGVIADVWSATSFTLLHRDGESVARWNLLHPDETPRRAYVAEQLDGHDGPVVASTDYVKTFAEQIRPFVERPFHALGTDGFGRSDTRKQLRAFFEIDRRWVALAALNALAGEGTIERAKVTEAIAKYDLDPAKPEPTTV
jgi:pyruvate dehydrogenase E1 component